jgi:hypothetical protein
VGKIWDWFFGNDGDLGHTNSRTKKTDPKEITVKGKERDPKTGRYVSTSRKKSIR